jgi:hypothetical protein
LHLLRSDATDDPAAVERFWRVTRASVRANATAGERVLDAGTDPETGRPFAVREWPHAASSAQDGHTRAMPVARSSTPHRPRLWLPRGGRLAVAGIAVVALGLWLLRPSVAAWVDWVNAPLGQVSAEFVLPPVGPAPAQPAPTPAAQPTVAPVAAKTTPTSGPTPTGARPTATPGNGAGVQRRIVNTDGLGVALRASPGGDRLPGKGYDEGTTVTAYESSGEWTRIRGSDGRQGWVLSVTLAP